MHPSFRAVCRGLRQLRQLLLKILVQCLARVHVQSGRHVLFGHRSQLVLDLVQCDRLLFDNLKRVVQFCHVRLLDLCRVYLRELRHLGPCFSSCLQPRCVFQLALRFHEPPCAQLHIPLCPFEVRAEFVVGHFEALDLSLVAHLNLFQGALNGLLCGNFQSSHVRAVEVLEGGRVRLLRCLHEGQRSILRVDCCAAQHLRVFQNQALDLRCCSLCRHRVLFLRGLERGRHLGNIVGMHRLCVCKLVARFRCEGLQRRRVACLRLHDSLRDGLCDGLRDGRTVNDFLGRSFRLKLYPRRVQHLLSLAQPRSMFSFEPQHLVRVGHLDLL